MFISSSYHLLGSWIFFQTIYLVYYARNIMYLMQKLFWAIMEIMCRYVSTSVSVRSDPLRLPHRSQFFLLQDIVRRTWTNYYYYYCQEYYLFLFFKAGIHIKQSKITKKREKKGRKYSGPKRKYNLCLELFSKLGHRWLISSCIFYKMAQ